MIKSILIFFSIILLISCSVKEESIDKGTFRIKNDTINSFTSVTIDDSTFLERGYNKNGFVMKVEGAKGMVNRDGNICKYGKFGYHYLNNRQRITKPLLRNDEGKFEEIS